MSHLKLRSVEFQGFRKFQDPLTLEMLSPAGDPLDYFVLAGPPYESHSSDQGNHT